MTKVLIIGGGFGGIRTALELAKHRIPDLKITLVSDREHFEYHATLYRVVTGRSPLEVCLPLRKIFAGKNVEVIHDTITDISPVDKKATGSSGSHYTFDYLVLALGSETAYLDIPGLREFSYGFKTTNEALRLRNHIIESFQSCSVDLQKKTKLCAMHFVVVGAGMSGVELAGELSLYTKQLAREYSIDPSWITIDLIEASSRILPTLPEPVAKRAEERLRDLGVNIYLNRAILGEQSDEIKLTDMQMQAKTVIWTAGVRPNRLHSRIEGLVFEKHGRVIVDQYLRPDNYQHIFVVGDAAATPYSGMAQTAILDAFSAARNIVRTIQNKPLVPYLSQKPASLLPIGSGWAAVVIGPIRLYGRAGWWARRTFDFIVFVLFLSFWRGLVAFRDSGKTCE